MAREILYGPMSILLVGFEGNAFTGKIRPAFDELRKKKAIRIVDALVVRKDGEGGIASEQVSDLTDAEAEKLGAVVGSLIGFGYDGAEGAAVGAEAGAFAISAHDYGLSQDEIKALANEIPNNSSALIAIVEHLWAKKLKQELVNAGGVLLANGFIDPMALVAFGSLLRAHDDTQS